MRNHNLPPWYIRWYGKYLDKRYAISTLRHLDVQRSLFIGAPQGGVSSPFQWNIVFDPLLCKINHETHTRADRFADDGRIIMIGKDLTCIYPEVQKALNLADEWGQDNGLVFNPAKTEVVIFIRKYKYKIPHKKLTMGGVELEVTQSARYLGLILDQVELRQQNGKCMQ